MAAAARRLGGAPQLTRVRIEAQAGSVAGANVPLAQGRADWVNASVERKGVRPGGRLPSALARPGPSRQERTRGDQQHNRGVEFVLLGAMRLALK